MDFNTIKALILNGKVVTQLATDKGVFWKYNGEPTVVIPERFNDETFSGIAATANSFNANYSYSVNTTGLFHVCEWYTTGDQKLQYTSKTYDEETTVNVKWDCFYRNSYYASSKDENVKIGLIVYNASGTPVQYVEKTLNHVTDYGIADTETEYSIAAEDNYCIGKYDSGLLPRIGYTGTAQIIGDSAWSISPYHNDNLYFPNCMNDSYNAFAFFGGQRANDFGDITIPAGGHFKIRLNRTDFYYFWWMWADGVIIDNVFYTINNAYNDDFNYMLQNAYQVKSVDMSLIGHVKTLDLAYSFSGATMLESIDMSNLQADSLSIGASPFSNNTNLHYIYVDNTSDFIINALLDYLGDTYVLYPSYQGRAVISDLELGYNYLCLTALEDNFTVSIEQSCTPTIENNLSYSLDGETWNDYTIGDTITLNTNEVIYWKGDGTTMGEGDSYKYFNTSGTFNVSGHISSLINDATELSTNYTFINLFNNNTGLIDASKLRISYDVLTEGCYAFMFNGCSSLTTAPELPATTLANYCYVCMFTGCSKLATAPKLPATTLAIGCYDSMFRSCSRLNYVICLATDVSALECTWEWLSDVASTGTFVTPNEDIWEHDSYSGIPTGWTVISDYTYPIIYDDVTESPDDYTIQYSGDSRYYKLIAFNCLFSASYTFTFCDTVIDGHSDYTNTDTYGRLFDADYNSLAYNDDTTDMDPVITYSCVAGNTYYFGVSCYSSSNTTKGRVTITQN